ncbi:hypothetical protein BJ912DRAFT_1145266 [Pholiota molesta]|nr:hypothetical protein BJ912DRAFT_1145266 [Pholiota molesta]
MPTSTNLQETPLFPRAAAVCAYLADYAAHFHLAPHIRLNTRVQSVGWDQTKKKWAVEVRSRSATAAPQQERYEFDMVLICNGHHNVPRYPPIPGLQSWLDARVASHSIFYRNPTASIPVSDLAHATILVVGGGPSGQDVTSDLLGVAGKIIFSSSANASVPPTPSKENAPSTSVINKPRTINFDPDHSTVVFADGTKEKVDYCILATGYEVDFPFFDQHPQRNDPSKFHLPKSLSSKIDLDSKQLTNSTWSVAPLARQIFPFPGFFSPSLLHLQNFSAPPSTSIAFLGLLVRVAPLPLVECQARAALAAFAYSSAMDSDGRSSSPATRTTRQMTTPGKPARSIHLPPVAALRRRGAVRLSRRARRPRTHAPPPSPCSNGTTATPAPDEAWERALYAQKGPLRAAWRALEASGEAARWLEGVGKGGSKGPNGELRTPEEEWVDLMWRFWMVGWEVIDGAGRRTWGSSGWAWERERLRIGRMGMGDVGIEELCVGRCGSSEKGNHGDLVR